MRKEYLQVPTDSDQKGQKPKQEKSRVIVLFKDRDAARAVWAGNQGLMPKGNLSLAEIYNNGPEQE